MYETTLKKKIQKILAVSLVIMICMSNYPGNKVMAAQNDDPGKNRLQGNIDDSFYGDVFTKSKTIDSVKNPYTQFTYTHGSAFDGINRVNGIDISQYNPVTDWNAVKASGIEFVIIRAGYRGYGSAGKFGDDPNFEKNMEGALAAGLKVGVYVYSQAINEAEGREEAEYLLRRIGSYSINMPLVMDYEYYSETGPTKGRLYDAKLTKDQATNTCLAFCQRIEESGYTPMVYANPSMLSTQVNGETIAAKYPIWLANYTTETKYTGTYQFWQYSSKGSVPGITGNVDMNIWYTNDISQFDNTFIISGLTDMPYTGNAIAPQITVTDASGNPLVYGIDYQVTYENNVNEGIAKVKITGVNNYVGKSKMITFRIVKDAVQNLKQKASTQNSVNIQWTDDGICPAVQYDIYRSTSLKGTYKHISSVNAGETSYQQSKLTAGKEYYYYVRKVMAYGVYIDSEPIVTRTKTNKTQSIVLTKKYTIKSNAEAGAAAIISVPKKAAVNVKATTMRKTGDTWYYVSYKTNGKTYYGYMPKGKGTLYRAAKTKTKNVNIRKGAGTSKKYVCTVKKKNTKVLLGKIKKDASKKTWYKVIYTKGGKFYEGYIYGKYVKLY